VDPRDEKAKTQYQSTFKGVGNTLAAHRLGVWAAENCCRANRIGSGADQM
jgi:hypothetical protein